jgi:hypothetical protein
MKEMMKKRIQKVVAKERMEGRLSPVVALNRPSVFLYFSAMVGVISFEVGTKCVVVVSRIERTALKAWRLHVGAR